MSTVGNLFTALVHTGTPDMTVRQAALLVMMATNAGPHTVRGTAAKLKVSKPVITRAATSLQGHGLIERVPDPSDARSVFLRPTAKGCEMVASLEAAMRGQH